MTKMKKTLVFILAVIMAFTMMPLSVYAVDAHTIEAPDSEAVADDAISLVNDATSLDDEAVGINDEDIDMSFEFDDDDPCVREDEVKTFGLRFTDDRAINKIESVEWTADLEGTPIDIFENEPEAKDIEITINGAKLKEALNSASNSACVTASVMFDNLMGIGISMYVRPIFNGGLDLVWDYGYLIPIGGVFDYETAEIMAYTPEGVEYTPIITYVESSDPEVVSVDTTSSSKYISLFGKSIGSADITFKYLTKNKEEEQSSTFTYTVGEGDYILRGLIGPTDIMTGVPTEFYVDSILEGVSDLPKSEWGKLNFKWIDHSGCLTIEETAPGRCEVTVDEDTDLSKISLEVQIVDAYGNAQRGERNRITVPIQRLSSKSSLTVDCDEIFTGEDIVVTPKTFAAGYSGKDGQFFKEYVDFTEYSDDEIKFVAFPISFLKMGDPIDKYLYEEIDFDNPITYEKEMVDGEWTGSFVMNYHAKPYQGFSDIAVAYSIGGYMHNEVLPVTGMNVGTRVYATKIEMDPGLELINLTPEDTSYYFVLEDGSKLFLTEHNDPISFQVKEKTKKFNGVEILNAEGDYELNHNFLAPDENGTYTIANDSHNIRIHSTDSYKVSSGKLTSGGKTYYKVTMDNRDEIVYWAMEEEFEPENIKTIYNPKTLGYDYYVKSGKRGHAVVRTLEPGATYSVSPSNDVHKRRTGYTCVLDFKVTAPTTIVEYIKKNNPISVSDMEVKGSTNSKTYTLSAKALGDAKVTFTVDDPELSINSKGVLTVPSYYLGTATITAHSADCKYYYPTDVDFTLNVVPRDNNTITIDEALQDENGDIIRGYSLSSQSFSLNATANENPKLVYKSDNKAVKVSSKGKVTINKKFFGTANIIIYGPETANYYPINRTVRIVMVPSDNKITAKDISKTVSAKNQIVAIGAKTQGGAVLSYESDSDIITVNEAGKLTIPAGYIGTANISIHSSEVTGFNATDSQIKVTAKPTTVKLTSAANVVVPDNPCSVLIKWAKNSYVDRYEVQYATSKSFAAAETVVIDDPEQLEVTVSGLLKKTYYIRVRGIKNVDSEDIASSWSSVKTVAVKK